MDASPESPSHPSRAPRKQKDGAHFSAARAPGGSPRRRRRAASASARRLRSASASTRALPTRATRRHARSARRAVLVSVIVSVGSRACRASPRRERAARRAPRTQRLGFAREKREQRAARRLALAPLSFGELRRRVARAGLEIQRARGGVQSCARVRARASERASSSAASPRNAAASPAEAAVVAARGAEASVPCRARRPRREASRGRPRRAGEQTGASRGRPPRPRRSSRTARRSRTRHLPSAPVHAPARASQKRSRGDGSSEGVMVAPVAGESARAAGTGGRDIERGELRPPTAGTVGVDVAISRRGERCARGCAGTRFAETDRRFECKNPRFGCRPEAHLRSRLPRECRD